MVYYHVWRDEAGRVQARVQEIGGEERPLDPRHDLWNHSPDGFEFGYGGSGPAQLALALLADALGDDLLAVTLHQAFKWGVIAGWLPGDHLMSRDEVRRIAERLDQESRR